MRTILVTAVLIAMGSAQDAAVPVEVEPNHKTVFENPYVQAFRVTLPPGQSTRMHTHAHDDAAIRLSHATITQESPGQPVSAREETSPGLVSARDNETKNLTHRVNNVGETPFDVIDVQVLERPPGDAAPAMASPAAENPRMRVYRYELPAGAASPQHTHVRPYLIVAATAMDLRMTSPDGAVMEHAVRAGDMHWVESGVTHTLANGGTEKGVMVEVELK
jgi:quercetin dioxygenase-like cupin family protein